MHIYMKYERSITSTLYRRSVLSSHVEHMCSQCGREARQDSSGAERT